ncbi:MAG: Uma2 family endonuclease [Chloroflexaceae bacterium]|nr:Uma2 family endonuclease [Chloroflexaceae bacterium]
MVQARGQGLSFTEFIEQYPQDNGRYELIRGEIVEVRPRVQHEIVSTNWRDDYILKLGDYEVLGIGEYWIVDYLALGAVRYIGSPKQPTITLCHLIDGEYQLTLYQDDQILQSKVFPALKLSARQIFSRQP